jgi:hypothetical protein
MVTACVVAADGVMATVRALIAHGANNPQAVI